MYISFLTNWSIVQFLFSKKVSYHVHSMFFEKYTNLVDTVLIRSCRSDMQANNPLHSSEEKHDSPSALCVIQEDYQLYEWTLL